jgi:hypothetical protein
MAQTCPSCGATYQDDRGLCPNDLTLMTTHEPNRVPITEPAPEVAAIPDAVRTVPVRQCRIRLVGVEQPVPNAPGVLLGRALHSPFGATLEGIGWTNISTQHCVLHSTDAGEVEVMDLDSSNGTFVNEIRIPPNTPRVLRPGDQLRLAMNRKVELLWD